jgi:hypothetical protein
MTSRERKGIRWTGFVIALVLAYAEFCPVCAGVGTCRNG